MTDKIALITGITGQDGSLLALAPPIQPPLMLCQLISSQTSLRTYARRLRLYAEDHHYPACPNT